MKEIKVDAMGDQCPIPVIKTKKALGEIKETTLVEGAEDDREPGKAPHRPQG